MERKTKNIAKLKRDVEINGFGLLRNMLKLRKNFHLYSDIVKTPERSVFEFTSSSAIWAPDFICNHLFDVDNFEYDELIIDLKIQGTIIEFDKKGFHSSRQPIILDLTLQGFVYEEFGVNGDVNLFNAEQKSLLIFHKTYEKELKKLNSKTLMELKFQGQDAHSYFSKIWQFVDQTDPKVIKATSYEYFSEFNEAYRNIIYSVACANIWGRYITHYTDHAYQSEGKTIYPVQQNFYDIRYITYLESAVESLYAFYERIAYLLYQCLKPGNISALSLSFKKLFERNTKKELKIKYPLLIDNEYYSWLMNFVRKDHSLLSSFRHPLVHYQSESDFIKGSYTASITRRWLDHATGDEQQLIKMHQDIEAIRIFVNNQLNTSLTVYEKSILLIETIAPQQPQLYPNLD